MNSSHRASITNGTGKGDSIAAARENMWPRRSTANDIVLKKHYSANIVLSSPLRIPWFVMLSFLAVLLVRILEGMFAFGLFGSTLVLLITFVEDIGTLAGREESHHS